MYCKSEKCLQVVQAPHRRGLKRVAAKFVQKFLNFDQKTHRMAIAQEMLNDVNDDPDLLKRVIIGDESCVYGYDQSPRPKKARQVRSNVKVLLTVFFDYYGEVHQEFLHKVLRLIRSITLKLCAICVKQYERNAWNFGKTIHGFYITITHLLTCHCLFLIFWPKTTP